MLSKRRILGLAVEGRSLTAVELAPLNGGAEATRAAEFIFPYLNVRTGKSEGSGLLSSYG